MNRNLDGVYFRVQRDNKWENICFSDLLDDEKDLILADRDNEWLKSLCKTLGDTIKRIGDEMDIVCD